MQSKFLASKLEHKKEFLAWVEKGKRSFPVQRLSELTDVTKLPFGDIAVGDTIEVINGYGHLLKGFTVLAIEQDSIEKGHFYVYLDWDCYWFPKNISYIVRKVEPTDDIAIDGVEKWG
ncbi:hypothetical protein [Acinetobacter baumannii]|uniref:hypothetical protein n=1 Tax=Acinetobacter baumannii TaxID=470 RepID=UPI001864D621|nr:hypothetical protein [Acinetobacter baumannii]HCW5913678.1 hypothetical protein [Acinetobacter baumannii]